MTTTPHLDVYELAFLAGGAERVVDTALVVLVESGRIRIHAPGQLAVVEAARRHPVEAAVLDAVGTHGHRSVDTIRWRLAGDERITGLAGSLAADDLLHRQRFPGRGAWRATRKGRQALDRPVADHSLDGGSALQVALHGRDAMTDADLRAAIFEPAPLPTVTPALGRRLREARRLRESDDPSIAAHNAHAAAGGAAAFGFIEGGGGDGGGF